ncbi:hypothetical protein N7256_24615 [Escherichia coli]|uniref:hypothetical protein n=1 Tax=Escherichia coli TaxID=562 RepID=UPI0021BE920A|nr:hypothetical protein [Escherichia coli]MCT9754045.1 hypothetical protein [Escherichia coli]
MGSCAAPSAKGDDKFITTDYLQQCPVNGVSAMPGESKELQLDLGLGDSRSFPIFPAVSGLTGRSEFMINIEELK